MGLRWLADPNILLKARSPRTRYSAGFGISPRIDTAQYLWVTLCSVWTPSQSKIFMFKRNFLHLDLCPLPLVLSLSIALTRVWLCLLKPRRPSNIYTYWHHPLETSSFGAKQSRLTQPLSIVRCPSSLNSLVILHWHCSRISIPFLYCGA